jgi:hypothetical protein
MPKKKPSVVTLVAQCSRLQAEHARLKEQVNELQTQVIAHSKELSVQFRRMAEMQAIIDEERAADAKPITPRPLFPAASHKPT